MTARLARFARPVLAVALTTPAIAFGSLSAPALAAFPGHNGVIAFTTNLRGTQDIWTVTPDGSSFNALTRGPAADKMPSYSADGKRIVFIRNDSVWLMRSDGSHQHLVSAYSTDLFMWPSFSPSGTRLIWNDEAARVFVSAVDGSHKHRLSGVVGVGPVWAPDGKHIAYGGFAPGGGAAIFVARPDGTHSHAVTDDAVTSTNDFDPDWSPDGKRLVFDRQESNSTHSLMVVPLDNTSSAHALVTGFGVETYPVFSPDGKSIAYGATDGTHIHVWRYFFSSQQTAEVGGLEGGDGGPGWQPR